MQIIPFIDIFAGPGGLSEGFSRYGSFTTSTTSFESRLAIEKDKTAVETLRLRSFFRSFGKEVPEEYYRFLRGEITTAELEAHPKWVDRVSHVWETELGTEPEDSLHSRIRTVLRGAQNWVLLGGPPCQAYSLMGRARMTGIGAAAREAGEDLEKLREAKQTKFASDARHKLYQEYLRIVAVHQPAVFVMENVKGILSSRLQAEDGSELVFPRIRRDLSDPWAALEGDSEFQRLEGQRAGPPQKYRLYSLVVGGRRSGGKLKDREFSIRSEDYGVPQRRHRVILLGVRDDIRVRPRALRRKSTNTVYDAIGNLPRIRSAVSGRATSQAEDWMEAIRRQVRKFALRSSGDQRIADIISKFCRLEPALDRGGGYVRAKLRSTENRLAKWYVDRRLKGVIQHFARSHMVSDLVRYLYASVSAQIYRKSPSLESWPSQLSPNHRNVTVDSKTGRLKADGFSDRFKVQLWDQPSSTVTSHIHKDGHYFIHPDPMQCRSLTVREAARLQTFPDNYFFCGNRTEQYKQVGNAVPPFLAWQIAGVVAQLLENAALAEAGHG